jgi:hypothetical protein
MAKLTKRQMRRLALGSIPRAAYLDDLLHIVDSSRTVVGDGVSEVVLVRCADRKEVFLPEASWLGAGIWESRIILRDGRALTFCELRPLFPEEVCIKRSNRDAD